MMPLMACHSHHGSYRPMWVGILLERSWRLTKSLFMDRGPFHSPYGLLGGFHGLVLSLELYHSSLNEIQNTTRNV